MNQPINRIFCAFPIFLPSEKMYQRNFQSVQSFVEYLNLNPHYLTGERGVILDIYFGGWSAKQEWFDTLKAYIVNNIPKHLDGNNGEINFVKVFQFDKNYGKASVVNTLAFDYDQARPNTQFMYTCDSDIKMMNSQVLFFERLMLAARCIEEFHHKQFNVKRNFAFISLNQSGENCHWFEPQANGAKGMDQSISFEVNGDNGLKINETLVWPSDNMGIAGGSLFVNYLWFKHIGGYRKFNKKYCGEDGWLLADAVRSNACVCIIKSLSIIHPTPTDDDEYRKWKDECMKSAFQQFNQEIYNKELSVNESWIQK